MKQLLLLNIRQHLKKINSSFYNFFFQFFNLYEASNFFHHLSISLIAYFATNFLIFEKFNFNKLI